MSKKGAKTQNKEQSYEVRDIVLAKVRGFPPWPGMVSALSVLVSRIVAPGTCSSPQSFTDTCHARVDCGPGHGSGGGREGASKPKVEKGELVLCTVLPCW